MTNIRECLHSKETEAIIRGLQALSNLLKTEYKEDVQRNTHLFLPQLLKLFTINRKHISMMKLLLMYLIKVSS